ncbi:MAG TPA: hypothetical protein VL463_22915 [Kofleriaceae bacterium]|nr:hypothetical protein [Kofleriaceae bacterium]
MGDFTVLDCDVCGAKVSELRRGRCWGCYNRWVDARPVGLGARCVTCGERRRRVLRSVELLGSWQPVCFNCHGQIHALVAVPPTMHELKDALERERRTRERRIGKPDTRVFRYERRVGQRRADPSTSLRMTGDELPIDDDMILEITIEEAPLESESAEVFEDLTMIRELVQL